MRKNICSQRVPMMTEYQASYVHPRYFKSVVYPTKPKNPYHTLRGTSGESSSFRSIFVMHQMGFNPFCNGLNSIAKLPGPPALQQIEDTSARRPAATSVNYNTVYKSDYRGWDPEKYQRCSSNEEVVEEHPSENKKAVQNKKPFETLTTYRLDYVPHKVQPRSNSYKPDLQASNVFPSVSSMPSRPQNQEFCNGPNPCFDKIEKWSKDSKFQSAPPSRDRYQPAKRQDMGEPMCQVSNSYMLSMQKKDDMMEAFQVMKCCKSWNGRQWFNRS